jgi:hypothetical protein
MKPNQKHSLQEVRKCRGFVESFHAHQGDFANGASRPELAQALTLAGAVRFTTERQALVSGKVLKHQQLWKEIQANDQAEMSNMPIPYPTVPQIGVSSKEVWLWDYANAQLQREAEPTWRSMTPPQWARCTRCPCIACTARRTDCMCEACVIYRRMHASA